MAREKKTQKYNFLGREKTKKIIQFFSSHEDDAVAAVVIVVVVAVVVVVVAAAVDVEAAAAVADLAVRGEGLSSTPWTQRMGLA